MTVRQLLNSLTSDELTEWAAYFRLENEKAKNHGNEEMPVEDKIKAAFKFPGAKVG
jgi:hypothetical protein